MKKIKRIKKWLSKTKILDLKKQRSLEVFKDKTSDDARLNTQDVIQGGKKNDETTPTVDPQWPVTH